MIVRPFLFPAIAALAICGALILIGQVRAEQPVLASATPARAPGPATMGGQECTVPAKTARLVGSLPRTAEKLRDGGELKIVAIGSSSTEGVGASAPSSAYPAQLERELARRFPMNVVRIVNKGVGGELVRDMAIRLERDAIDQRPTLVIWQTGTNDANHGISRQDFVTTLKAGIDRLHAADIDVLVLDPQYTPRVAANGGGTYTGLFHQLPSALGVAVFYRQDVMQAWVDGGKFTFATMLDQDRFHMNDRSYRCLAVVLGEAIEHAARY